jgi:hypothetical protein
LPSLNGQGTVTGEGSSKEVVAKAVLTKIKEEASEMENYGSKGRGRCC